MFNSINKPYLQRQKAEIWCVHIIHKHLENIKCVFRNITLFKGFELDYFTKTVKTEAYGVICITLKMSISNSK